MKDVERPWRMLLGAALVACSAASTGETGGAAGSPPAPASADASAGSRAGSGAAGTVSDGRGGELARERVERDDEAAREAMPALHFVVDGSDAAMVEVGGSGTYLAYVREALARFAARGAGRRMAFGLTMHPRWPARRACTTNADCGAAGACSTSVPKFVRSLCTNEEVGGYYECAQPAGAGVGLCPGTMQVCTGSEPNLEEISGRLTRTCAGCDVTPFCLVTPRCGRDDYATPDVALGAGRAAGEDDAASDGVASVLSAIGGFAGGGGGALEGAYRATTSHASRYAAAHPRARVAVVIIGAGSWTQTPCFSSEARMREAAAAMSSSASRVRTFAVALRDDATLRALAKAGGGALHVVDRPAGATLADRLDAALASIASSLTTGAR